MVPENEPIKRKPGKYQKLLKEFSQESSAGGINKIFSSKPVLIRSIWVLLCLVCYSAMIYLSFSAVKTFFTNPTSTFIDVSFETVSKNIQEGFTEGDLCSLGNFSFVSSQIFYHVRFFPNLVLIAKFVLFPSSLEAPAGAGVYILIIRVYIPIGIEGTRLSSEIPHTRTDLTS